MPALPMIAGGNIAPMRFVKISTAAGNTALQCGDGEMPVGISQRGSRNTPWTPLEDGFCAIAGESFQIYGDTETAMLEIGTAVAAGDFIASDADGKGKPATAGLKYGAQTAQAAAAGKIIEVRVIIGELET